MAYPNMYQIRGAVTPSSPSLELTAPRNVITQVLVLLQGTINRETDTDTAVLRGDSILNLIRRITLTVDDIALKNLIPADHFWKTGIIDHQISTFELPDVNETGGPTSFDFSVGIVIHLDLPFANNPNLAGVAGATRVILDTIWDPRIDVVLTPDTGDWTVENLRATVGTCEYPWNGLPLSLFLERSFEFSLSSFGGAQPQIPLFPGAFDGQLLAGAGFVFREDSFRIAQSGEYTIDIAVPGLAPLVANLPFGALEFIANVVRFGTLAANPVTRIEGVFLSMFTRADGLEGGVPIGPGRGGPYVTVTTEPPTATPATLSVETMEVIPSSARRRR